MKILAAAVLLAAGCARAPLDSQPMPRVELARYMGRWYEIARYPSRFEKGCHAVTADYALQADGAVSVLNTCREGGPEGPVRVAKARAWSEHESNSRFQVSFFRPFKAPYWIIALAGDYRWAVVGHPRRDYLWVLSRAPVMTADDERAALAAAAAAGYDLARLERPNHAAAAH
jgi:apolipoprotein D and lipocalin family protein